MSLAWLPSDEAIFLNGEPEWKSRLGPGWVGTKLLGKGGQGVAGLWEYKEPAENAPAITQVVVKMSEAEILRFREPETYPRSKIDEGVMLKLLAACKSKHIVRMYGGNKLGDKFGCMGEVVRIFIEYCPGGDLGQLLAPYEEAPLLPLQEVDVWALFHCMALSIVVMERGTEDLDEPAWDRAARYEMVHFDLKAENIFLGKRDEDHGRMPVAKIGDFGEAYSVMKPQFQTDKDGPLPSKRGTDYYQPPEEVVHDNFSPFSHIDCPWPRKGTCSNIWQIGTIMNQLLLRVQKRFDDAPAAAQCKPTSIDPTNCRLIDFPNHSIDLETPEITFLYSLPLITLIMECLLRPTNVRPTASDLVRRTQAGYENALADLENMKGKDKPLPPPPGMMDVGFAKAGYWDEPPLAWEVDDTTAEYLEVSHHMSQKADVYLSPSKSTESGRTGSGLTEILSRIFSRRAELSVGGSKVGSGEIGEGWEDVGKVEGTDVDLKVEKGEERVGSLDTLGVKGGV